MTGKDSGPRRDTASTLIDPRIKGQLRCGYGAPAFAAANTAILEFYLRTVDTGPAATGQYFRVTLDAFDPASTPVEVFRLDGTGTAYEITGYTLVQVDVSAFAVGQGYTLRLEALANTASFHVDDFCLKLYTADTGTGEHPFEVHDIDPATALNLYLFRAYDPHSSRWLTREPLGLDGPNLYAFVGGNPTTNIDYLGLMFFTSLDDPRNAPHAVPGPSSARAYHKMMTGAANMGRKMARLAKPGVPGGALALPMGRNRPGPGPRQQRPSPNQQTPSQGCNKSTPQGNSNPGNKNPVGPNQGGKPTPGSPNQQTNNHPPDIQKQLDNPPGKATPNLSPGLKKVNTVVIILKIIENLFGGGD